jgi:phosphoglycerate dehydrogenase-like enzyme
MTDILLLMPESHRLAVFGADGQERLARCGTARVSPSCDYADPAVAALIAGAEVIVTGTGTPKLDDSVLEGAPRLRAIVHTAGTVRPIVDVGAYDRGVQISSQAPANALPVAEYALAMILLELKGVRAIESVYRAARAEVDVDAILADSGNFDRTVGVIGASVIGRRLIELLAPFDLDILVYDPFLADAEAEAMGVARVELPELLATSDLVTVHAPLLPETRGMIGAPELRMLRDGAVLVNTARGALIDQGALEAELMAGRIRAVVDVTDPEVPHASSRLWDLPNLVLTPHVAGSRGHEMRRIGQRAVDEIERFARGEALRYAVSRERYATNA